MAGEKVIPVAAGVCNRDIRCSPIRQHDVIAPDFKDCRDYMIPNISKVVGWSRDREFLENDLEPTDGFAHWKRLGDPRLNRRTGGVLDLELRQRIPWAALL